MSVGRTGPAAQTLLLRSCSAPSFTRLVCSDSFSKGIRGYICSCAPYVGVKIPARKSAMCKRELSRLQLSEESSDQRNIRTANRLPGCRANKATEKDYETIAMQLLEPKHMYS
eukprot:2317-Heterococcus_DN1.PRE.2